MKKRLLIIVKTVLVIIGTILLDSLGECLGIPINEAFKSTGNDTVAFMGDYVSFLGIWVIFFIVWAVFKNNRPMFRILGPDAKGNNIKTSLSLGLIFGLGINLLCGIIAAFNGDIKLTYNGINIGYILGFIAAVGIKSGAEELAMRGHLYQKLRKLYPNTPAVAIILNGFVFALLHVFNDGVTALAILNIFFSGLMFSLMVYYFDSFWAPVIAHTGWNFCQNIILGLPNSGIVSQYSIFRLDVANARSSFAYDVGFGIEGTITSLVVLIIACAVIIVIGRKRNQKPLDIWVQEESEEIIEKSVETINE